MPAGRVDYTGKRSCRCTGTGIDAENRSTISLETFQSTYLVFDGEHKELTSFSYLDRYQSIYESIHAIENLDAPIKNTARTHRRDADAGCTGPQCLTRAPVNVFDDGENLGTNIAVGRSRSTMRHGPDNPRRGQ